LAGALNAEVFRACSLEMPHASLTTLSIHLLLQLVITGRFVAMLPGSVVRLSGKNWPLKILPIKLPSQPKPVAIMRLKNRTLSPVAQVFIDCARAVARAIPAK
jgi:DNA-binding transcriptional LysR family regulator